MKTRSKVIAASSVLLVAAVTWAWVNAESSPPDEEVRFERSVSASLDQILLANRMGNLPEWRKWFYSLSEAVAINESGVPLPKELQIPRNGARILLKIDPGKGKKRRFEIVATITRFEPGKALSLQVVTDSSGRIFRNFTDLAWSIEIDAPMVKAIETGHTKSPKARFFARVAPRILMSQLLYPNAMALADPNSVTHSTDY